MERFKSHAVSLLMSAICVSGWVMYVFSDIHENRVETERIKEETASLMDSINQSRPPEPAALPKADAPTNDQIYRYLEALEEENRNLRDSMLYYSLFYRNVRRSVKCEYHFSMRDSADKRIYEGYVVFPPEIDVAREASDSLP